MRSGRASSLTTSSAASMALAGRASGPGAVLRGATGASRLGMSRASASVPLSRDFAEAGTRMGEVKEEYAAFWAGEKGARGRTGRRGDTQTDGRKDGLAENRPPLQFAHLWFASCPEDSAGLSARHGGGRAGCGCGVRRDPSHQQRRICTAIATQICPCCRGVHRVEQGPCGRERRGMHSAAEN